MLYKFALDGEETRFLKLLLDKDVRIHPYAIRALQKLTGERLAKGENVSGKRLAWIKHFKDKKTL